MPLYKDQYEIVTHRTISLTERYKGQRVSSDWILRFAKHNVKNGMAVSKSHRKPVKLPLNKVSITSNPLKCNGCRHHVRDCTCHFRRTPYELDQGVAKAKPSNEMASSVRLNSGDIKTPKTNNNKYPQVEAKYRKEAFKQPKTHNTEVQEDDIENVKQPNVNSVNTQNRISPILIFLMASGLILLAWMFF